MSVISITITESPVQIIAGIPRSIVFETNIPATVFYTLDGTTPTLYSDIAIGAVILPTDTGIVTLKAFASDGFTESAVFSYTFSPNTLGNRNPRDKVIFLDNPGFNGRAFGDIGSERPSVAYTSVGGVVVDSPGHPGPIDGYGANMEPVSYTDEPYNFTNYEIVYSQTDQNGDIKPGIGDLPAKVTIIVPEQKNKSFNANSKLLNPKAMVIYQDGTIDPADPDHPIVNREFFSLPLKKDLMNDGQKYYTTGFEGSITSGSLIRPFFNSADNTYTFYYRDALSNRWIISKDPVPNLKELPSLAPVVVPHITTKVFRWFPFQWTRHNT